MQGLRRLWREDARLHWQDRLSRARSTGRGETDGEVVAAVATGFVTARERRAGLDSQKNGEDEGNKAAHG